MTIYGTAAGFRQYHEARGRDVSTYDADPAVEAALLVASEWLDNTHRSLFKGYKVGGREQVREWPRYSVFDHEGKAVASDTVPVEVENATYEAALRQLITPGALTLDYTPNKYRSVNIQGSVSVVYAGANGSVDIQTQYTIIEQMLDPLLGGTGSMAVLSGPSSRV
jgi:hypothetical protein